MRKKQNVTQRLSSVFLTIGILATAMPMNIAAADGYTIWVNGIQFTSSNAKSGITCGSGKATLDVSTSPYTITLDNATITNAYAFAGVWSEKEVVINTIGKNVITLDDEDPGSGIMSDEGITLNVKDTLDIEAISNGNSGIYAGLGDLAVNMDGTLNISAENRAIFSCLNLAIDGKGTINVNKCTTGITSDTESVAIDGDVDILINSERDGMTAGKNFNLSGSGDVTIKNSTPAGGITSLKAMSIKGSGNLNVDVQGIGLISQEPITLDKTGDITIKALGCALDAYDSIVIAGTGTVDATSVNNDTVWIHNSGKLSLEGQANPISLQTESDAYGICAVETNAKSDIVIGSSLSLYNVEGSLDSTSVVYTLKVTPTPVPSDAPSATPTAVPTAAPTAKPQPTSEPSELNVGDFVERCYQVALGRKPDEEGFDSWVDQLNNGQACGSQVGYGFIFSGEYINKNTDNKEFVKDLYSMFFGRKADEEGFGYWVDRLDNNESREVVFAGFANSQEFYNLCEKYGVVSGYYAVGVPNTQQGGVNCFVARLYRICLNRLPDIGSQTIWVQKLLNSEETGSSVAYSFMFSPEFIQMNLNDADFVAYMYRAFFGREAGKEEINGWVDNICNGMTREEVYNSFSGSIEFDALCSSYGIVR